MSNITPPPELVQQWASAQNYTIAPAWILNEIAQKAAQWGADQELEACCEWIPKLTPWDADKLHAARRPKPQSLKQQALEAARIELIEGGKNAALIIRALEALPE